MSEFLSKCNVEVLKESAQDVLIRQINNRRGAQDEDAFFVADMGDVVKKWKLWQQELPRVEAHYAVKCNDDPVILSALSILGAGFDCASKAELQKVLDLGVAPHRIIYANPCKQNSHIKYAARKHVSLMTFDNETELHKVKATYPNAKLVIRILPPEGTLCQCPLGMKFGVHPKRAAHLLHVARKLDLDVVGVSFHVGSGCYDSTAFSTAVAMARTVFDMGREAGYNFTLLDIGGGFPGQAGAKISFEEICVSLRPSLDTYFPPEMGVRLIAEPGRFFVASAFTLAANIIARRVVPRDNSSRDELSADDEPMFMYYVNDGVYGSFNCLLYDHAEVTPALTDPQTYADQPQFECSIWGPTCDGLDCISKKWMFPALEQGDWLQFPDMGAYTCAAASSFNGMPKPQPHYIISQQHWQTMCEVAERQPVAGKGKKARTISCGMEAVSTCPSTPQRALISATME